MQDDLNAMRGVVNGLAISIVMWAIIIGAYLAL